MSALEDYEYTCSCYSDSRRDHNASTCMLWDDPDFANGNKVWDEKTFSLIDIDIADEIDAIIDGLANAPACSCHPQKDYFCDKCGVERVFDGLHFIDQWRYLDDLSEQIVEINKDKDAPEPICECKPQAVKYCWKCGVRREDTESDWEWWDTAWTSDWMPFEKCRHYFEPVTFPDGTVIYASSQQSPKTREDHEWPDFGIYLAASWEPVTLAYFIDWRDFGLPTLPWTEIDKAVLDAMARSERGEKVELGCIGGHGRTGTFLALVAVRAGIQGKAAVKWVKDNYCKEAVESKEQEWYVLAYEALINGNAPPPKPETTYKKYSDTAKKVVEDVVESLPKFPEPTVDLPKGVNSDGMIAKILSHVNGFTKSSKGGK